MDLAALIRDVPDFPSPGVVFKDITPLLGDPAAFASATDRLVEPFVGRGIDVVVAVEARGFIVAGPVAHRLGAGLVPMRKPGKLPRQTVSVTYDLEYGTDRLEVHDDAIARGDTVLVVDDVLATGGTAAAAATLVESLGGVVAGLAFVMELTHLGGAAKLGARERHVLLTY